LFFPATQGNIGVTEQSGRLRNGKQFIGIIHTFFFTRSTLQAILKTRSQTYSVFEKSDFGLSEFVFVSLIADE
jgi:hypothetical protein